MDFLSTTVSQTALKLAFKNDKVNEDDCDIALEGKQVIQTLNGAVGTGKTNALIKDASRRARLGEKILIVEPTKVMIKQILLGLEDTKTKHRTPGRYPINAIYSEDENVPCVKGIWRHIKECREGQGEILVITHAAFYRLPWMERKSEWHVYHDEVPDVIWSRQYNLADHHDEILPLFHSIYDSLEYEILEPQDNMVCRDITMNETGDEINLMMSELTSRLDSNDWTVYTHADELKAFTNGERKSLQVFATMAASAADGWRSFSLLGADLSRTQFHLFWATDSNVAFIPHKTMKLKRSVHTNGHRVTIYYGHQEPYTLQMRKRMIPDGDGMTTGEANFLKRVEAQFDGVPWVFLANKNANIASPNAVQMPNNPHGINSFRHLHHVAIFAALNPTPSHIKFLTLKLGLDGLTFREVGAFHSNYQAAGRISTRMDDNEDLKQIVVPDLAAALSMQAHFPGSTVVKLPGFDPSIDEDLKARPAWRPKSPIQDMNRTPRGINKQQQIEDIIAQLEAIRADSTCKLRPLTRPFFYTSLERFRA